MSRNATGTTLSGEPARFAGGLHDVGSGVYAWLQPNGGLGEANAGLIVGDGESAVIDTLWDHRQAARMNQAMRVYTACCRAFKMSMRASLSVRTNNGSSCAC